MINKTNISPIGIGTFGIGGLMKRDETREDQPQIDALRFAIDRGLNYIDVCVLYADGYANHLVKNALIGIDKDKIFVNAKLGNIESVGDIESQLDEYLQFFGFDYVDSFQIHSPSRTKPLGIEKVCQEILRLVDKQKVRYLSVSNFGPKNLELAMKASGNKVFSLENDYSFDVRPCEDVGLLDYCSRNEIMFIAYRPIRTTGFEGLSSFDHPIIHSLASKYDKTKFQILINWYAWKENVMPLISSGNVNHVKQNLKALEFDMEDADYKELDSFRLQRPEWDNIDWEYEGTGGTKISELSFVF